MIFSKIFALILPNFGTHIMGAIGIFAGVFGIGFLIGFHELGHFLFAKLFRVDTPAFSVGFGPRLITKKIGGTEFSLSAIPLGGYVQMTGMGDAPEEAKNSRSRFSFVAKPFYQKLIIMSGGILFNLIFAYVAFTLIFMTGMPQSRFTYPLYATPLVEMVEKESPAMQAGLLEGDKIISINGKAFESGPLFYNEVAASANKPVVLAVERNGQEKQIAFTPTTRNVMGKETGCAGIMLKGGSLAPMPLMQAISNGIALTNKYIYGTFASFKHIFTKFDASSMAGPLMIISVSGKESRSGFATFIIFLAIISINLAILNLIPLPILDGGQMLFYGIEALIGRSIPTRIREFIFIGTWIIFGLLFIYLSYKDIIRILESCGLSFQGISSCVKSLFSKCSK